MVKTWVYLELGEAPSCDCTATIRVTTRYTCDQDLMNSQRSVAKRKKNNEYINIKNKLLYMKNAKTKSPY